MALLAHREKWKSPTLEALRQREIFKKPLGAAGIAANQGVGRPKNQNGPAFNYESQNRRRGFLGKRSRSAAH